MVTKPTRGIDRRQVLSVGVAASTLGAPVAAATQGASSTRQVTITEATNIAVSAAPNGKTLAFDLYGVIWTLPIQGGAARRLTDDLTEGCQPDWSPDGKQLVFQSYRDGTYQIWTVRADGTDRRAHV